MTNTFQPLTWTVKLICRSVLDVISMTREVPVTKSTDSAAKTSQPKETPKDVKFDVLDVEAKIVPVNTSAQNASKEIEKNEFTTLDLDGYQYRFYENEIGVEVKKQEYQLQLTEHPILGTKLLPTGDLIWKTVRNFPNLKLLEATEEFIKSGLQQKIEPKANVQKKEPVIKAPELAPVTEVSSPKPKSESQPTQAKKATFGTLISMGDRTFPDKNKPGKTFENFAITVKTNYGDKPLQGEGLREALAECSAQIGDKIKVQRLEQIMVPCINKTTQKVMTEPDGSTKMVPKWLWSITVLNK